MQGLGGLVASKQEEPLVATKTLLQPIVRWLLAQGVPARDAMETMKVVFVESAKEHFGSRGRLAANTRVEMLTGIDRKEVSRILSKRVDRTSNNLVQKSQRRQNKITRILTTWLEDPEYMSDSGHPMRLRLRSGKPNLEGLVKQFAGDIGVGALVKAMVAAGSIRKTGNGSYAVQSREYVPLPHSREQALRYGSVINDLARTLNHNLLDSDDSPPQIERRVTETLPLEYQAAFSNFLERKVEAFIDDVDGWLANRATIGKTMKKKSQNKSTIRLGIGLYFIHGTND